MLQTRAGATLRYIHNCSTAQCVLVVSNPPSKAKQTNADTHAETPRPEQFRVIATIIVMSCTTAVPVEYDDSTHYRCDTQIHRRHTHTHLESKRSPAHPVHSGVCVFIPFILDKTTKVFPSLSYVTCFLSPSLTSRQRHECPHPILCSLHRHRQVAQSPWLTSRLLPSKDPGCATPQPPRSLFCPPTLCPAPKMVAVKAFHRGLPLAHDRGTHFLQYRIYSSQEPCLNFFRRTGPERSGTRQHA